MAPRSRRPILVEDLRPVEPGYLSLRSLRIYSGLSVKTLRNLLKKPIDPLPHFKTDGKILVKKTEFDAWMARRRVDTNDRVSLTAIVDDVMAGMR